MICRERKLIFVHIPKCGGSSVEKVFFADTPRTEENLWMGFTSRFANKYQTGGLQHLTAELIRREVGAPLFEECFKFALVRSPLARLESQYRHMGAREDLRRFVGLKTEDGFSEYLDKIQRREHVQWKPQCEFLYGEDGSLLVDRVFKLEELARNAAPLYRALGRRGWRLPRANRSDRRRRASPSEGDKARVRSLYARDYRLLGYDPARD